MPARISVRRKRRQTVGKLRVRVQQWYDPYPYIEGTEPEKRIFEQLVKLRLYFIFQGQIPEFGKGGQFSYLAPPVYKPDFVLPEYKVILDPFGPFVHSREQAAERDWSKVADYNIVGYAYYRMWALDHGMFQWSQGVEHVSTDPHDFSKYRVVAAPRSEPVTALEMLRQIPELWAGPRFPLIDERDKRAKQFPGYRIGEFLGAGANSVGAANHLRKKMPMLALKRSPGRPRR